MTRWRNIVIGVVIGAVLASGALFAVVNSARAMAYLTRTAIGCGIKTVKVRELSFGSLAYTFPSSWSLKDVRCRLLVDRREASFTAARLDLGNAGALLSGAETANVSLSGAEGSFDKLKVNILTGRATLRRNSGGFSYQGDIDAAFVVWDKVGASAVRGNFLGDVSRVALEPVSAELYGGKVVGKAMVVFARGPGYELDATVEKVDIAQLDYALGGVFHELGGKLSGRVAMAGAGPQIDRLEMSWDMPSGGKVSAALLSSIASYLPASVERKRIDSLIRSGGKLAVEVFSFTIKNDAPDHLSGVIGLKSREANLELNITHEVKVDARLDSLLQAWQAVFKQERL